jgi:hypothetical protein
VHSLTDGAVSDDRAVMALGRSMPA